MCSNLSSIKDGGNVINGSIIGGSMFWEITCFVLGVKDYGPLEVRLVNNFTLGNSFDIHKSRSKLLVSYSKYVHGRRHDGQLFKCKSN